MIGIIEEHNLLSGYRFVIVEYLVVGMLLGLLGLSYALAGRTVDAVIWLGMAVNCSVIALIADATLRTGAIDFGILPMRSRTFRELVRRDHPHLLRRTSFLITVTFAPFLVLTLVAAEMLRDSLRGVAEGTLKA